MNDTDLAFATVIVPYGHEKADTGLAGLDDIICGVIMLVGGTIAMALIRTERVTRCGGRAKCQRWQLSLLYGAISSKFG
jgi:hypothetical protein